MNFVFDISSVDKKIFWTNKGMPNIKRSKTKYSNDDFFIIEFNLLLNLDKYLLWFFLNIFLKKRKKHKLPKTIVIILIRKPTINPKKKLELRIIIKLPGIERAKNKKAKIKNIVIDTVILSVINKSK